mgnify:CR=1 FL=1
MKKLLSAFSIYLFIQFMVIVSFVHAQNAADVNIEMADQMRSDGKIYVVVLVVLIAFTGLMIYAISTDRKLSRLEKEIKSLKSDKDL